MLQQKPLAGSSEIRELFRLLRSIVVFLLIAFMLRVSVVEAFKIPSSSMEQTLQIGDHILVNKLSYGFWLPFSQTMLTQFREPQRGDIVVFTRPDDPETREDDSDTNIIKRVIGLPGDEIRVEGTSVFINNQVYEDDHAYTQWLQGGNKDFGPKVVPPGKVLLLGDNRDFSKDSRYWKDPFLDMHRIKGRAFMIYWNSNYHYRRIFNRIR